MVFLFFGKMESEEELAKKLRTEKKEGTSHTKMKQIARREGFKVITREGATITIIKNFLKKGKPVIVNYIEKENNEGHYAIVTGINKGQIIMNDPWFGKDFKMEKKEFMERWKSEKGDSKKWLMAITGRKEDKDTK